MGNPQQDDYNQRMEYMQLVGRMRDAYLWLGGSWNTPALGRKTFKDFDTTRFEKAPEAIETVRLFARDLQGTLVLHGPFGVGKTHLLAAMSNAVIHKGTSVRWATAPALFAAIQHAIQNGYSSTGIIEKAIYADLFVLDDIDKAKHSEFREETYYAIFDQRVTRGLPCAISTNRLSELAMFVGGAVASRLSIGQVAVEMVGEDYRPQL